MEPTETPQMALARQVRDQRLELGLSLRAAAKLADIDRNTWYGLEEGTRKTQERHFAAVERALRWPRGHIANILEGAPESPARAVERPAWDELRKMTVEEFGALMRKITREEGLAAADAYLEEVRGLYANEARKVPPRR